MKPVTINGRAAIRPQTGGVERCARELTSRLPALAPERYTVRAPRPRLAHGAGHGWEQLALPALARSSRLVLSPANAAPLVAGRRNVVLIFDVAPLRDPAWFGGVYGAWHRRLLPLLLRVAGLVIAPSRYVADELAAVPGAVSSRIRVVAPGRGLEGFGAPAAGTLERLGVQSPYVLAVGTDSARKNLGLLDELAPMLAEAGLSVVIVGGSRSYLTQDGSGGARRLGYVPDADLHALYAGARVLAMPSLYEGFGLPPLEAMAAQVPVVSSNRGALPETCANAAILVDPEDHRGFLGALLAAAADGRVRDQLIDRGGRRAASFTWQRAAGEVDGLIGELLDGPRAPAA